MESRYHRRIYDYPITKLGLFVTIGKSSRHDRNKCPCFKCFEWRRWFLPKKLYWQRQKEIRKAITTELRLGREFDKLTSGVRYYPKGVTRKYPKGVKRPRKC